MGASTTNSRTQSHTSALVLALALVSSGAIFALDLKMPLGVAVGVLYVPVMLASSLVLRARTVVALAVLMTVLIILGWALSPGGGILWMAAANRSVCIVAVWAIPVAALWRHRVELETAGVHRRLATQPRPVLVALCIVCPVHAAQAHVRLFVTPGQDSLRVVECSLCPGRENPSCQGRCVVLEDAA